MAKWNLKDATVTIGGSPVAHGLVDLDATEEPVNREILNAANSPYPTIENVARKAEGTVGVQWDDAAAFPDVTAAVALIINATGFYFSGNVRLSALNVKADPDPTKVATGGFKFSTVDGSYTFAYSS